MTALDPKLPFASTEADASKSSYTAKRFPQKPITEIVTRVGQSIRFEGIRTVRSSPNLGASALLAAVIPALSVTGYWFFTEREEHTLLVLLVALIFCFGYTLFVVIPLFWLLGNFFTFRVVSCVLLGALLAAAPPFLGISHDLHDLHAALSIAGLFALPGMAAGYLFFVLQRMPSNK
jgi:hypothetical protein